MQVCKIRTDNRLAEKVGRGTLLAAAASGAMMLSMASLPAQAATIFGQPFDGASTASLQAGHWTFDTQGTDSYGSQSGDAYLRFGGNTTTNPTVTAPSFGAPAQSGSLYAVLGASTSYAGIYLEVLGNGNDLFNLQIQSQNSVYVNGLTKDSYADPNESVATLGTGSSYANRLTAAFSWQVAPDGTGGTFNYTLNQPDSANTHSTVISTGQVSGRSFITNGVPESILLETTKHDNAARSVLLYELDAQSLSVPEPAPPSLRGVAGVGASFFTPPSTNLQASLDPQGIYPRGQMLGFGLYSTFGKNNFDPTKTNMQRVAQAGFTLSGPVYGSNGMAVVDDAAANGLHALYSILSDPVFANISDPTARYQALATLSDQQIHDYVAPIVQAVINDPVANKTVSQWYLMPEEVPANSAPGINYLQVAADTIRQVETSNGLTPRPISEYQPTNVTAANLITVGQGNPGAAMKPLDVTTAGIYLTKYTRGDQRSGFELKSLRNINQAAATLGTVPQADYEMDQDFTDPLTGNDPVQITKVLRHDVYLGLVSGIKSMEIFSDYQNRPNFTTHEQQFDGYASVAHDLTGPLDLQNVFLFGEKKSDLTFLQTSGQSTITYVAGSTTTLFGAINTLDVEYGDARYLFLVNNGEDQANVTIAGLPSLNGYLVQDLFAGTTVASYDPFLNVTLDNLGVRAFKLTAIPEPATATLMLLCGSAVLLRRRVKGSRMSEN